MNIIDEYLEQISELQKKIEAIQNRCLHPQQALEKKHGANTGNYDPSSDCYWTDFHCKLCQKKWVEDGSK